ncbi:MAG: hypothetical protein NW224_07175 [Leptolyngbyaceae cyanobacterium bins.302]|nr:hypothetical protein [Leptolyngbyaceae cyanobacterium bins.302]
MVFMGNSAGLLTLVGDPSTFPSTFIVSTSINVSFVEYLQKLSLGGAIAVATMVCTLSWLFKKLAHRVNQSGEPSPPRD